MVLKKMVQKKWFRIRRFRKTIPKKIIEKKNSLASIFRPETVPIMYTDKNSAT